MKIDWHIDRYDVDQVKALIAEQTAAGNRLIRRRKEMNLSENKLPVTRPKFWREMVLARLTVQARSGPKSPVHKLSKARLFPLALRKVRSEQDVEGFIAETFKIGESGNTISTQNISPPILTCLKKVNGKGL